MKSLLKLTPILMLLCLSGCSNYILPQNTVLDIQPTNKVATVQQMDILAQGRVCSVGGNNSYIYTIGISNNQYTIDIFQLDTENLVNIIVSDSKIFEVQATTDGFYYSKLTPGDPNTVQIIWAKNDKSTERTITDRFDDVDSTICAYGNDKVIYVNNQSELVFSDSNGNKNSYPIGEQLDVSEILYNQDQKIGFFIAENADGDTADLYRFEIDGDELSLETINHNVLDMDFNKDKTTLAFIYQHDQKTDIREIQNLESSSSTNLISAESLSTLAYNTENDIYYSNRSLNHGLSTIWYYEASSGTNYQLTSPLELTSGIISIKPNNEIYFSQNKQSYLDNTDKTEFYEYIIKFGFST